MQSEKSEKKKRFFSAILESMAKTGGCCGSGKTCGGSAKEDDKATGKDSKCSDKDKKK